MLSPRGQVMIEKAHDIIVSSHIAILKKFEWLGGMSYDILGTAL